MLHTSYCSRVIGAATSVGAVAVATGSNGCLHSCAVRKRQRRWWWWLEGRKKLAAVVADDAQHSQLYLAVSCVAPFVGGGWLLLLFGRAAAMEEDEKEEGLGEFWWSERLRLSAERLQERKKKISIPLSLSLSSLRFSLISIFCGWWCNGSV